MKKEICSFRKEDLREWLKNENVPAFAASQILDWIYKKSVTSFDEMSNLSKSLRNKLSEEFSFPQMQLQRIQKSDDEETFKFLWKFGDGQLVESVLICSSDRRTVCVSSQVGCPARCAFCASGKNGFFRNLTTAQIVEQVLHINSWLQKKSERVSHIVFMGMGEPLENLDAVLSSIRIFNDPDLLNISQRRITVSTVGVVEGIWKMVEENLNVSLVLSLHAPNQRVRKKIIPYARKYELEDVLEAMDAYAMQTKRNLTYEYILIHGINDQVEHAQELAQLVGRRACTVNLIPYNPVEGLRIKKPQTKQVYLFRDTLDKLRVRNTCRFTKGDDIAAACGQLALQESEQEKLSVR